MCCFDFHLLLYYLYVRVFHCPSRSFNTSLRILSYPASLYCIFLAAGSKRLNIYFSMYFIIPMSLHDPFIIAGGQIWGLAQIMLLTTCTVYSLLFLKCSFYYSHSLTAVALCKSVLSHQSQPFTTCVKSRCHFFRP